LISAQKLHILCVNLGILVTCSASYLRKSYQVVFFYHLSFTCLTQLFLCRKMQARMKMHQVHKISLLAKSAPLAKSSQNSREISPSAKLLAKFRSRRPNFAISVYFAISEVASEGFRHQRSHQRTSRTSSG